MKYKRLILFSVIILFFISVGAASAHENTTVIQTGDGQYNAKIITEDTTTKEFISGKEIKIEITNLEGNQIKDAKPVISFDKKHEYKDLSHVTSDGKYSFHNYYYPEVGTHKVSFKLDDGKYKAKTVTMNLKITKSPTKLTLYKHITTTKEYATLKAKITSGKNRIYDGTVTFKVNGKSYKVKISQNSGFAIKKIKLTKAKTYTYSATFKSKNFKNRYSTSKVYVKPAKKYYTFSATMFDDYQTTGKTTYNLPYKYYLKLLNARNKGENCYLQFKGNIKVKGYKWFNTKCGFDLYEDGQLRVIYIVDYYDDPIFASKTYDIYKTI